MYENEMLFLEESAFFITKITTIIVLLRNAYSSYYPPNLFFIPSDWHSVYEDPRRRRFPKENIFSTSQVAAVRSSNREEQHEKST